MASYRQDGGTLHALVRGLRRLTNGQEKYLMVSVCLLALLLLFSIFKNISYPLFWADESMTVMGGVRVLQFGYPKVHDGKNVFYDLVYDYDKSLGIDPETDAYIGGANWGQYYIAAVGVRLAELTDDIFIKTGIIRSVFALFGLTGLLILARLITHFFQSRLSKRGFLAVFLLLTLISVPLALHLREARYYSLTIFFSSLVIYIFTRYRILKKMRYALYLVFLPVSLFILFLVFSPAFVVFLVTVALFESASLIVNVTSEKAKQKQTGIGGFSPGRSFRSYFLNIAPCLISAIAVYPLFIFFDVANISTKLSEYYAQVFQTDPAEIYLQNLSFIWDFFRSSGFIYLALSMKILLVGCFVTRIASIKNSSMPELTFSLFLSIFFIVYFFSIAKIPNPLFTRYFVNLQPILIVILVMDTAVIFKIIKRYRAISGSRSAVLVHSGKILAALFIFAVIFDISANMQYLKGHIFQLTHKYEGPLDHIVPFILNNFANSDDLVIATNYEETSLMYYLGAKVTVGYAGNNLEADAAITPDIIVFRKFREDFTFIFNMFLKRNSYDRISFPVYNSPVNNIPELHWDPPFQHLFQTQKTEDNDMKAAVYLRRDIYPRSQKYVEYPR